MDMDPFGENSKAVSRKETYSNGGHCDGWEGVFWRIERGISWSQRGVYPAPWREKLSKVDGDARVGQVRVTNPFWVCG